jgi:hypothetical protein
MPTVPSPRSSRWPDLHELQQQFPSIPLHEIGQTLIDARRSVDLFGLSQDDEDSMVQKIAVEQLKQRIGESTAGDLARLDPETHKRRIQRDLDDTGPTVDA